MLCARNNVVRLTSCFGNLVGQLQHLHQIAVGPSSGIKSSIAEGSHLDPDTSAEAAGKVISQ